MQQDSHKPTNATDELMSSLSFVTAASIQAKNSDAPERNTGTPGRSTGASTGAATNQAGSESHNPLIETLAKFLHFENIPVTRYYESLPIGRAKATKMLSSLEDAHLIRRHTLPAGKGAPIAFAVITPAGNRLLHRTPATPICQGGAEHEATALACRIRLRGMGLKVETEYVFHDQGARADLVARHGKTEKYLVINIGMSCAKREAHSAYRILQHAMFRSPDNKFILVARNAAFIKQFQRTLRSLDRDLVAAVGTRLAGYVIKTAYPAPEKPNKETPHAPAATL